MINKLKVHNIKFASSCAFFPDALADAHEKCATGANFFSLAVSAP